MSLNIKNPDTYKDVSRLAQLTGESLTQAVWTAVKERLLRLKVASGRSGMAIRIKKLATKNAERFRQLPTSDQVSDGLFDELGVPK